MSQSKIGNRLIIIAGASPANANASHREPADPRPTVRRIVVIRNGEAVGSRPDR
jgi:hypothetical protein